MVHCELCGDDVEETVETKISGAELEVCPDCSSLGTRLSTDDTSESETKYSTENSSTKNTTAPPNENSSTAQNEFPDTLMMNFGKQISRARSSEGLNRAELADELNIKESRLKKVESETMQPNEQLQNQLEKRLDIDLSSEEMATESN